MCMAAKPCKDFMAAFNGFEQMKCSDRAAGAVSLTVLARNDDGRFARLVDDARRQNADHAAVPVIAVHDDATGLPEAWVIEPAGHFGEHRGLGSPTILIELLEFCSQIVRTASIASREQLDYFGSHIHAARGIDSRCKPKGHVDGRQRASCRVDLGLPHERAQSEAYGTTQLRETERNENAILAQQRNSIRDGGNRQHLEERGQNLRPRPFEIPRFQQRLRQLERHPRSAQMAAFITTAPLVWIEDRKSVGNAKLRFGQMMIGDDQVKAQLSRGFGGSEGSNAGVDADHEANAFARGDLKNLLLHAVAFAQPVRNVKANAASEHLDGRL